jgi:hypothetical protein
MELPFVLPLLNISRALVRSREENTTQVIGLRLTLSAKTIAPNRYFQNIVFHLKLSYLVHLKLQVKKV